MTLQYQNPYPATDPDIEENFLHREPVSRALDGYLLHRDEPSCISIVAERGLGGRAAVRQFLASRINNIPFRILECDVKSELGLGKTSADFYRGLVRLILKRIVSLPEVAKITGGRLLDNSSNNLGDLEEDLFGFFRQARGLGDSLPLLLVFYSFDRLPRCFDFEPLDWSFLKEFNSQIDLRLYYLIVSRRPLRYIESLHGLQHSLFSTIFRPPLRIGLLTEQEARDMIRIPAESVLKQNPWHEWLAKSILNWGGRNPYCTTFICSEIFELIWNQGEKFESPDADKLAWQLTDGLREYFDRLLDNLEADQLLEALIHGVEPNDFEPFSWTTAFEELIDLGYFLPEPAKEEQQYILFSPLFHNYLVRRGILHRNRAEGNHLLSEREVKVLRILASGRSNPEIAEALNITVNTVKKHLANIYDKLEVHGRVKALEQARILGIVK